jgi:hypothetical protein
VVVVVVVSVLVLVDVLVLVLVLVVGYRLITSSSGQSEAEWILQVPFWALFQGTFGAPA